DAALAALRAAAGRLRGSVGRAMNLKKAPQLRFVRDHASAMSAHLTDIVRDDERRARAAGRDPGTAAAEPEEPTDD
ncbi:MAG TPA: hypothetical protein VFG83_09345, partial [Kofleriaceae bacterium]|nr:hypothetical protein [Kofleriaceae bacterium]